MSNVDKAADLLISTFGKCRNATEAAQALHDVGLLMPDPDQFTYVIQELTPTGWEDVATYSHEHKGKAFSDVMQYQPVSHPKARVMRRFEEVAQP